MDTIPARSTIWPLIRAIRRSADSDSQWPKLAILGRLSQEIFSDQVRVFRCSRQKDQEAQNLVAKVLRLARKAARDTDRDCHTQGEVPWSSR